MNPTHLCPSCLNDEITTGPSTYICRRCRHEWAKTDPDPPWTSSFIATNQRVMVLQDALLDLQIKIDEVNTRLDAQRLVMREIVEKILLPEQPVEHPSTGADEQPKFAAYFDPKQPEAPRG